MKMSHQKLLTNYFSSSKEGVRPQMVENRKKCRQRDNSEALMDISIVLSSDEENNKDRNLSQASTDSDKTVIYTVQTPVKVQSPIDSFSSSSKSSSKKFYSPNRKRTVSIKSPRKIVRRLDIDFSSSETVAEPVNDLFLQACKNQDDKTKFLLTIVNDLLKEEALNNLLKVEYKTVLSNIFLIPHVGMKLVCRLFWRQHCWYETSQLAAICAEDNVSDKVIEDVLGELVNKGFLWSGNNNTIGIEEFIRILKVDQLKEICKELKLKFESKGNVLEVFQEFCKRKSIGTFFGAKGLDNTARLLKLMNEKTGGCYRLSEVTRGALDRLYILTYLGIDYDIIRQKKLEFVLINEMINRETYPIDKSMKLDNASVVFENADEFERYIEAHYVYEDFISKTDCEERCEVVKYAYRLYEEISMDHIIRYKSLPCWLQRFTPTSKYVKLLHEGIQDLKRGKNPVKCELAAAILTTLLGQTFRSHKKAEWYAEKALVLHSYLGRPEEAARVLIEGFECEDISEECKDLMRPRALKLARQKNVSLPERVRAALTAHADKPLLLESSIPNPKHVFRQPLDNPSRGKAQYESRGAGGRAAHSVEEAALAAYVLDGDVTCGAHWEGKFVSTLFFLLFWDIIYSRPERARGIFMSHLQRHPLDLFTREFYANRRAACDARLAHLDALGAARAAALVARRWQGRPESEVSSLPLPRAALADVAAAAERLPPRAAAALCRRLLADYGYAHSGFPDLTMWDDKGERLMFVEVKSDSDRPSVKQIQWLRYLRAHGMEAQFCYVGAKTARPRCRLPHQHQENKERRASRVTKSKETKERGKSRVTKSDEAKGKRKSRVTKSDEAKDRGKRKAIKRVSVTEDAGAGAMEVKVETDCDSDDFV